MVRPVAEGDERWQLAQAAKEVSSFSPLWDICIVPAECPNMDLESQYLNND